MPYSQCDKRPFAAVQRFYGRAALSSSASAFQSDPDPGPVLEGENVSGILVDEELHHLG